jgi:hypothetical protein
MKPMSLPFFFPGCTPLFCFCLGLPWLFQKCLLFFLTPFLYFSFSFCFGCKKFQHFFSSTNKFLCHYFFLPTFFLQSPSPYTNFLFFSFSFCTSIAMDHNQICNHKRQLTFMVMNFGMDHTPFHPRKRKMPLNQCHLQQYPKQLAT